MVQPEIQAAQDAPLGTQKLGPREGASTQEAEGGRLWMAGKRWESLGARLVAPCPVEPRIGSGSVLNLDCLVCKMGLLICSLEVMKSAGFRISKTWVRLQALSFSHRVYMNLTEPLRWSFLVCKT